jgi:AraC-like DNA-binding protein
MIKAGPDEKIYPVVKLATIVDSLGAEGISPTDALNGVHISNSALSLLATRVSLNQVIECCHNAARLSRNPRFAYQTGLRFHVSTFGMYGFAILSSTSFRQTIHCAVKYHELATPLAELSFKEEGDRAEWTIVPIPHPRVDASLYKFLVELQFGIHASLHRDVMGPSFAARELHVTYSPPSDDQTYPATFGCPVFFNQPENKFVFDASWLDRAPTLGNEITYLEILKLCDELMEDLQLRVGLAGKVRELLLVNLMRPTGFDAIANHLHMTTRTLRRKLREEHTSFRKLVDELRMHVAIKYLRDTHLTIEDIAFALGFSDAANFRHAFRRWTSVAPLEFRTPPEGFVDVRRPISPD